MRHNDLFSFAKSEVDAAFTASGPIGYVTGIKLIGCPAPEGQAYGKLLIITPRASGKAHDRNLMRRRMKAIFYQEKLYETPRIWIALCNKRSQGLAFEKLQAFMLKYMKA